MVVSARERCRAEPNATLPRLLLSPSRPAAKAVRTHSCVRPSVRPSIRPCVTAFCLSQKCALGTTATIIIGY
ncbi:hypothetical protein ALC62_08496 [Cyphomyrmex costatus]|uniref:Uncharacterized protein n=1 Tax=Cyphomyrmex costatus TaxID=456900 RepID=A0A195CJC0_9HYME|nr:hypothetical protein ALC62_08496 [Cyphomyrmex costatus]